MGRQDRDRQQAIKIALDKAWTKWAEAVSYQKSPQCRLHSTSTIVEDDLEYDMSERLMEELAWDDEIACDIQVFTHSFYDDTEKGIHYMPGTIYINIYHV